MGDVSLEQLVAQARVEELVIEKSAEDPEGDPDDESEETQRPMNYPWHSQEESADADITQVATHPFTLRHRRRGTRTGPSKNVCTAQADEEANLAETLESQTGASACAAGAATEMAKVTDEEDMIGALSRVENGLSQVGNWLSQVEKWLSQVECVRAQDCRGLRCTVMCRRRSCPAQRADKCPRE